MEANSKLLKKKRIAHSGGKLSKNNLDEEPKLPPDDFVLNIMKDMDSTNVISYQQLQEFRSKKRQKSSLNEEGLQSLNSACDSKQAKKNFPKKSFPLMKKCQTSIKYLKKNLCIPKPRAHVGFVPKPPNKYTFHTEQRALKFESGKATKLNRSNQSYASHCMISQPDFKAYKIPKLKNSTNTENFSTNTENINHVTEENRVDNHLSSSEEDDAAFESFVQKVTENANISSDTDSDSRFIIHRKKRRNKSKQRDKKKRLKRKSFSENERNTHVSKITSIPLSDSPESQSDESSELKITNSVTTNKSLKRKAESPVKLRRTISTDLDEAKYSSDPSEDPLGDVNSSDCESNEETAALDTHQYDQPHSYALTSFDSCKNLVENEIALCDNKDILDNLEPNLNDFVPCYSETTKSVPKYETPCYVRLKRDPNIDKKALTLCSMLSVPQLSSPNTVNSFEDDCILIDENSDNDVPSLSVSVSSPTINRMCQSSELLQNSQKCDAEVLKSNSNCSILNSQPSEKNELDDCVFMCEMSKINDNQSAKCESYSLSSKCMQDTPKLSLTTSILDTEVGKESRVSHTDNESSMEQSFNKPEVAKLIEESSNLQTESDNEECVIVCEKSKPHSDDKVSGFRSEQSVVSDKTDESSPCNVSNEFPSIKLNEGSTIGSEAKEKDNTASSEAKEKDNTAGSEAQEFNVQIVAVRSLTESNKHIGVDVAGLTDIEVIDLSDDELMDRTENEKNPPFQGEVIQQNVTATTPCAQTSDTITCANTTSGSTHQKQGLFENQADKGTELKENTTCEPDPKIFEILSKINFECIRDVINKTKLDETKKVEENSIRCNIVPGENISTGNEVLNSKKNLHKIDRERASVELSVQVHSPRPAIESVSTDEIVDKSLDFNSVKSAKLSSTENYIKSTSKTNNYINNFPTANPNFSKNATLAGLEGTTSLVSDINTKARNNNLSIKKELFEEVSSEKQSLPTVTVEKDRLSLDNITAAPVYYKEKDNKTCINSKQNPEKSNILEVPIQSLTNSVRLVSNTRIETPPQIKASNSGKDTNVPIATSSNAGNKKINQTFIIKKPIKNEIVPQSPSDDLDVIATSSIHDLNPPNKKVIPLLELYKKEYAKYKQIKNTEENVSAGLKLLEENQVKKLAHLHSSIKNLIKHDACFYKANQEDFINVKTNIVKSETISKLEVKNVQIHKTTAKEHGCDVPILPDIRAKSAVKFDSSGTSREEVLQFMRTVKCVECGKPAAAVCQGCKEVYYCSPRCGELSWNQGHNAVCKRL